MVETTSRSSLTIFLRFAQMALLTAISMFVMVGLDPAIPSQDKNSLGEHPAFRFAAAGRAKRLAIRVNSTMLQKL